MEATSEQSVILGYAEIRTGKLPIPNIGTSNAGIEHPTAEAKKYLISK